MKKNVFLTGILSMVLVFGTALFVGCKASFNGSTLAGTKWVSEETEDLSFLEDGLGMKVKVTLNFTSTTAGTITVAVTEWIGTWEAESKTKMEGMITAGNGPFTSIYDSATKAGTVTYNTPDMLEEGATETTHLPFTVDVSAKTLTTTEVDGEETEITVFKLQ
jgi:hypothetical protein